MNNQIHFLKGTIEGFKEVVEIREECGIYNVSPTQLIEDKAYLKGLEYAYNIIKGDK